MMPMFERSEPRAAAARERFGLMVARGYAILAKGCKESGLVEVWTRKKEKGK